MECINNFCLWSNVNFSHIMRQTYVISSVYNKLYLYLISHVNILHSYNNNPYHMNITYKSYTMVIVCLLASCFMCRNVSLGLLCIEMTTDVTDMGGYECVIWLTYVHRMIFHNSDCTINNVSAFPFNNYNWGFLWVYQWLWWKSSAPATDLRPALFSAPAFISIIPWGTISFSSNCMSQSPGEGLDN